MLQEGVTAKDRTGTHLQAGGGNQWCRRLTADSRAETRRPSGEEPSLLHREMDTFAFSFLLWFLPSELRSFREEMEAKG